jgi:catechol 2,3-dioxygenase-like lactoylglutathione lyase family enzyme
VIRQVFHFSFTVSNLDRSVAWYTNALGLELVHRQRQDNQYTRQLVGFENAILEVAQFKIANVSPELSTHVLELVEYVQPRGKPIQLDTCNPGVAHLAFVVSDIHDEYNRLRNKGVRFRSAPVEITAGVNRGGHTCYFWDPDGITLELVQRPFHGSSGT